MSDPIEDMKLLFEEIRHRPRYSHSCSINGHTTLLGSLYCPHCGTKLRDRLSDEEYEILEGLFNDA